MNSKSRAIFNFFLGCIVLLGFSGCLYTTHHFNTGQLLEPGNTSVTLGAGLSHNVSLGCPEGGWEEPYKDTKGSFICSYASTTVDTLGNAVYSNKDAISINESIVNGSFSYRLGVSGKAGPFTGLELGMHIEAPTNPISGEFDLQMGLPAPKILSYHSLSLGWSIGAWADNSYFMEYAASRMLYASPVFLNIRETYLATQPGEQDSATTLRKFHSKRRWITQVNAGWKWNLPEIRIVPDFIVPELGLTFPLAPIGIDPIPEKYLKKSAWNFSFGFGWNFK